MLLDKECMHNLCTVDASVNTSMRGALVCRGPQDSEFMCLKAANVTVSSFSGHSSRLAGLG